MFDELSENIPDSFFEVLKQSEIDIDARLPPQFMANYGPRQIQKQTISKEIPNEHKPICRLQAIWRGKRLRRKLEGIDFGYQTQYNQACWDYMRRENNFVHAMKRAIKEFETLLGDNNAGKKIRKIKSLHTNTSNTNNANSWQSKNAEVEVKQIVSGFKAIIEIHQMLYEEIQKTWDKTWPVVKEMGKVLIEKIPLFIVYNMYVEMFYRIDGIIHSNESNPELKKWMNITAGSSQYKRTLREVLKLPFDHLTGCTIPIQRFLNCVLTYKKDITDKNHIVKAFALLQRLKSSIEGLQCRLNLQRALILESSMIGLKPDQKFANLQRNLIIHGTISINKVWSYIFLFDDICVVCQQHKDSFTFEHIIKMKGTSVKDTSRLGFLLHSTLNDYHMLNKKPEEKVRFFIAFEQVASKLKSDRFGVSLSELISRESKKINQKQIENESAAQENELSQSSLDEKKEKEIESYRNHIPLVVLTLSDYLRKISDEKSSSDFFCLGSDTYSVTSLKNRLNSVENLSDCDLNKFPLHVIVEVLRVFLLELPSPLLDKSELKHIFKDRTENELYLYKLYEYIQKLDFSQISLLYFICDLLSDTCLHPSILAQTWGHTLYRTFSLSVTEALDVTGVTTITRNLLLHYVDLCSAFTSIDYFKELDGVELEILDEDDDYDDATSVYETDDNYGENSFSNSLQKELDERTLSSCDDADDNNQDQMDNNNNSKFCKAQSVPARLLSGNSQFDSSVVGKACLPPPIGVSSGAKLPPPPTTLPAPPAPMNDNDDSAGDDDSLPPSFPPPAPPVEIEMREKPVATKKKKRMSVKNFIPFRGSKESNNAVQDEY